MDVQLDQLRTLRAVVATGSFEAAARALGVTPSAVSQRVKALESALGRVLVRRGRPATTTPAGTSVLRLATEVETLLAETAAELETGTGRVVVPLVVNADSLDTWALPALADLPDWLSVHLVREDERHSAELLREGAVMAAVTVEHEPVQGCTVRALGALAYRPVCAPALHARCFLGRPLRRALREAPLVQFDAKDALQDDLLARHGVDPAAPPRHRVPGSGPFLGAVRLGLGWGMVPAVQADPLLASGELVALEDRVRRVPLYWQQWSLRSRALDHLAASFARAAQVLDPPGAPRRGARDNGGPSPKEVP